MVKGKQTKLVELLYKDEILDYVYEIYQGSDVCPHVRTYIILNDDFKTRIKLEELGQYKKTLIEELEANGFKDISKNLILKKVA